MNTEVGIYLMRQTKEVFDKYKIQYWLSEGTLLGAIRDNSFIPWDEDIDFCAWKSDIDKIVLAHKELLRKGLKAYLFADSLEIIKDGYYLDVGFKVVEDDKLKDTYEFAKGIKGEILNYILWVLKGYDPEIKKGRVPILLTKFLAKISFLLPKGALIQLIEPIYKKHTKTYHISYPAHLFKEFKTINFYGLNLSVPKYSEEFLRHKYGDNWRTPIKRSSIKTGGGFLDGYSIDKVEG